MTIRREDIELLAPAGNFETLRAAIQGKADAVYFGVGKLNMRARAATGFSVEDLPEIAGICKDAGIKSYLTVNAVIYDGDIPEMERLIQAAKDADISAIIVSDMAAAAIGKKIGINMHASTQLNISNSLAVQFYAQFFDTVVLARELKLEQMKEIYDFIENNEVIGPNNERVRLEAFAHGALCMSISGKCYLSLHLHDKSANRGACFQPCRRQYEVKDKETGFTLEIENEYIMSPKDLKTINFLDKLLNAGIKVLKIEGRGRSAEYVKRAAQCYDEAIKSIALGEFSDEKIQVWNEKLSEVYNRGYWDGYYLGKHIGEWSDTHGSKATKKKVYLGEVKNYFKKIGVCECLIHSDKLEIGDAALISGPTTGAIETVIEEMRDNIGQIDVAEKGKIVAFKTPSAVRKNDKLYKIIDA